MPDLFADTSGWANLIDVGQPYHSLAANLYYAARQQKRRIFTTNYILTELVALLTNPLRIPRPAIIAFIDGLKASSSVEVIYIDVSLDEQAWVLLKKYQDKNWSLVDCVSFTVMKQFAITEALTSDRHFEQAGFVRLLKP